MYKSRVPSLSLSLLLGIALASAAPGQDKFYITEGLELSIKAPPKWGFLGREGEMGSLRALYAAPRGYAPTDGRAAEHTPTMRVLWFAKDAAQEASAKKSNYPMRAPYTDVRDYVKRVNGAPGAIAGVDETQFGKFKGLRYVVDYKRDVGSLTQHIAVVKMDKGELAIEFEVLKEQYKRMRGSFDKALATLSSTPADKIKKPVELPTPLWIENYSKWEKLPTAARAKERKAWGARWLAARKALGDPGWKVVRNKNWLVLTRTDSKFTKRITQAADVARKWIEKRFAGISDEVVMPAVLKIFESRREETALRLRDVLYKPHEYDHTTREIYAFKDASMGNLGDGYGKVIRGVFQQFVHDKHHKIMGNIPRWLDNGLWGYFDSSRVLKGKKLIFFPGEVEMGRFKYHADHKAPQNVWWFTHEKIVEAPKDGANEPSWGFTPECTRLIRWFDEGGSKAVKVDDLLPAYLGQIGKTALTFKPNPMDGVDLVVLKDGQRKELNKEFYAWRAKFLETVNFAVMPLPQTAWPEIDKSWQTWNAEFAKRKFKKK